MTSYALINLFSNNTQYFATHLMSNSKTPLPKTKFKFEPLLKF